MSRLLENVQKRFPHTTVLAAFDIFNPRKMPSDDNLLLEYGNEEVVTLAEQFKGVVASAEVCQEEWSGYRQFLREWKLHEAQ